MNICAQTFGHSLSGQKKAYQNIMHANKFIPLLISQNPLLYFLPLQQDHLKIYINFARLRYRPIRKNRSILTFVDDFPFEDLQTKQIERNYFNAKWYLNKIYSSQSSQ